MDYHWKFLLVVSFFTATAVLVDGHSIAKRNAFQLCNLVTQFTNRSCLSYNDYGCFCGLGQQAAQPTDSSDRCCMEHDDCYGAVNDGNYCYFWRGLFVGYEYTCQDNVCLCTDQTKCARKVCECDLKLAKCLGKSNFQLRLYELRQNPMCCQSVTLATPLYNISCMSVQSKAHATDNQKRQYLHRLYEDMRACLKYSDDNLQCKFNIYIM